MFMVILALRLGFNIGHRDESYTSICPPARLRELSDGPWKPASRQPFAHWWSPITNLVTLAD